MKHILEPLLEDLDRQGLWSALAASRRGIEKESLRFTPDGRLAHTPHPRALGSPLTHPYITTDFCEAQLELITEPMRSVEACLAQLDDVHRFVHARIGDENLWAASMPCVLDADDEIPLARYGTSNVGRAKTVYRSGLGYRYGRAMQTISGIHYNFSFDDALWAWYRDRRAPGATLQDARSAGYFALIRNFRRNAWLLLYLFGASPALCHTFLGGRPTDLERRGAGTLYRPGATTLRMGDLGYQSDAQRGLHVSYNSLDDYAGSLFGALTTPHPAYERIGTLVNGEWRQLSTSLLQIENEFYGTIRPKRSIMPGERPLHALDERGVEYVEVRCLDVDPFLPLGIDATTLYFLDTFLTWCLLHESPEDSPEESRALGANQAAVVDRGRDGDLVLALPGRHQRLRDWGRDLLDGCGVVAAALDTAREGAPHGRAVERMRSRIEDDAGTPSARVLAALPDFEDSFYHFARHWSDRHQEAALARPLDPARLAEFDARSEASHGEQAAIEAADTLPFDRYLEAYLDPARLRASRRADSARA